MVIKTGNSTHISLLTLIAIYSISMVISLPGLAISPILGELEKVFPTASQFSLQLLASISSFVVIPFVLLSGRLSISRNKKTILRVGLLLFAVSTCLYFFAASIRSLLWISVLLGVGAGLVIPLSKGLIALYFSGRQRQKQLGISSGITNVSLVIATMIAGGLASVDWHWSFGVYGLSFISLVLAFTLHISGKPLNKMSVKAVQPTPPAIPPMSGLHPTRQDPTLRLKGVLRAQISTHKPFKVPYALMIYYFTLCVMALAVPIQVALLLENYRIGTPSDSGKIIALFFLAIMLPGFMINYFIHRWRGAVNLISIFMMVVGLSLFIVTRNLWILGIGSFLVGFGYGIMQPIVYEKAVAKVSASHVTFSLSLVMTMNYIAIIVYPVLLKWGGAMLHADSVRFPFQLSFAAAVLMFVFGVFRRRHEIFGMPELEQSSSSVASQGSSEIK